MKQFSKELSFTLIEILVSIFIIVLMAGIIFANYRVGGQQFALQRSANKLAQDIRRVQQMAMSAKEYQPGQVPTGGYGVSIDTNLPNVYKYILFADIYEPDSHRYDPGNDYLVEDEEIPFEKGVKLKNPIQTEQGDKNQIDITFVPPDPQVNIVPPAGNQPTWCRITLVLDTDPNKTKTVKVNKAGLIEVE